MPAIEVRNLQKTFLTKRKAAGMSGSLRALVRPEYSSVEAVRWLTFKMEPGELLGFIGPIGAGKSTTIKMLTGILHPTGGQAQVLGYVPWKDRQKVAYHWKRSSLTSPMPAASWISPSPIHRWRM